MRLASVVASTPPSPPLVELALEPPVLELELVAPPERPSVVVIRVQLPTNAADTSAAALAFPLFDVLMYRWAV
jgi:hypothetical protein